VLLAALGCAAPGPPSGDDGESGESADESAPPTPECDPLAQDCPAGEACYYVGGDTAFACEAPVQPTGGLGDPCSVGSECDIRLDCSSDEIVVGCANGFGCCTAFCEIGGDPCPMGLACEKLFASGAPPGFEGVGLCGPG
jgi:hypothetical protein